MRQIKVGVIGAGPAGLTASWKLSEGGADVTVYEADAQYVGGIARTVEYKGFRFDIGGHRFFSKSQEVEALWEDLLGKDLLTRPRSSRILYGGKFYAYPLKAQEAFFNLGVIETARCVLSYAWAQVFPRRPAKSFEDWVSNQFGQRLFEIFFKTYTEKVWGMSCKEISADWAAQRIKGLSLAKAVWSSIFPQRGSENSAQTIKTLINSFRYPRLGPGMMWDAAAERTRAAGGKVHMGVEIGFPNGVQFSWIAKPLTYSSLSLLKFNGISALRSVLTTRIGQKPYNAPENVRRPPHRPVFNETIGKELASVLSWQFVASTQLPGRSSKNIPNYPVFHPHH